MSRLTPARRRLLGAIVGLAAAALVASPAAAHAELTAASPAANGSVAEAPDELRLTFSEPVDAARATIELLDTQGRSVVGLAGVEVSGDGLTASVSLPPLDDGVYTVSYQVVSTVDGHATRGTYAFLIDPTGAAPPPADSAVSSSPSVDGLTIAARWLGLAALLVAAGGLLLWWHAARRVLHAASASAHPPWRLVGAASLLAAVSVAAYLMLAARPIPGAGTGIPLDAAGPFGWTPFAVAMRVTIVAALGASLMSALALRRRATSPRWWIATAFLLAAALGGMSASGHVASIGGPAFAALDWLHLVAVAAWLGGLPAAAVLSLRFTEGRAAILRAILRGHGRMALLAAPVVVLSGIANSPLVIGQGRDLVASDYGNLLVAKAMLVAVALGIGAANHLALRGRGRAAVAALVSAELAVAVLAVGAAAAMVTIQPASVRQPVLNAPPIAPAHFFDHIGPSRVHLAVSLPAPGTQAYRVTVRDAGTGAPRADVQRVFLGFTPPPATGLPPQRVILEPDPLGGLWTASGSYTPVAGDWWLEVTVRRHGQRDESATFPLDVLELGEAQAGPPPVTGIGVPAPVAALWGMLPDGPAGWLPAVLAFAALALLWRVPPSTARERARGAAAAALLVAFAAAGSRDLVVAANQPSSAELAAQPPVVAGDADRGRDVYLANCAVCHGVELDGDGPLDSLPAAGGLAEAVRRASDAELSYRIAYGTAGTAMPAFAGRLTVDERGDLIAYLNERLDRP